MPLEKSARMFAGMTHFDLGELVALQNCMGMELSNDRNLPHRIANDAERNIDINKRKFGTSAVLLGSLGYFNPSPIMEHLVRNDICDIGVTAIDGTEEIEATTIILRDERKRVSRWIHLYRFERYKAAHHAQAEFYEYHPTSAVCTSFDATSDESGVFSSPCSQEYSILYDERGKITSVEWLR